jgi:hypothetical protein
MNNIENSFLSLPISNEYRDIARSFAAQQPFPQVADRLSRNTLSVLIIRDYLEMMGIPTNLEASDSWHPVVRICADVADLEIEGLGKLECRSLQVGDAVCYVPPEVWEDRIGYVVVQIEEDWRSAKLLGFVKQVSTEDLEINRLEPIENLCIAIAALREANQAAAEPALAMIAEGEIAIANFSNWLRDVFESGWQELEHLLDGKQARYAYRTREITSSLRNNASSLTEVRRGKLFDLGSGYLLALIVTIMQTGQNEINIRLSAYPISDVFLPEFLKLLVLDTSGNIFLQAQARSLDNYIQLQFSGNIGEEFTVQIAFAESSLIENFVI